MRELVETYTCNRCPRRLKTPEPGKAPEGWSEVQVVLTLEDPKRHLFFVSQVTVDLCPACYEAAVLPAIRGAPTPKLPDDLASALAHDWLAHVPDQEV